MSPRRQRRNAGGGPGNQLRIIAGKWRGRRLPFPDADGLRPTGDRIRETLFNWLAPCLPGARCLDAFAGSGALGLEALSRGAASVTFLEKDTRACQFLEDNCRTLGAAGARVERADATTWLAREPEAPADILFLDPPFAADLQDHCLQLIREYGHVRPGSLVYVESPAHQPLTLPPHWLCMREKVTGNVCYRLLEVA